MRAVIHTGFIFDNVIRLYKKDIGFSSSARVSEDFFIDFIFEFLDNDEKNEEKI